MGYVANDRLAAGIDVDMLDSDLLFAAPPQLCERINLSGEGPCQAMQREAIRVLLRYLFRSRQQPGRPHR